jgi:hypothetical protein
MKTPFKPLAAVLVALGTVACSNTSAQLPEQHIAAIKNTRVQEADYLKGLATAVKEEKRNDVWAVQKETELRSSYAVEKGVPPGALKSIDCRSSKCDLQFQLRAEQSPKAPFEQHIAINEWIAASQPCGYTMTPPPGAAQAPGELRIFLNCSK